jgi:hypothetical protein
LSRQSQDSSLAQGDAAKKCGDNKGGRRQHLIGRLYDRGYLVCAQRSALRLAQARFTCASAVMISSGIDSVEM